MMIATKAVNKNDRVVRVKVTVLPISRYPAENGNFGSLNVDPLQPARVGGRPLWQGPWHGDSLSIALRKIDEQAGASWALPATKLRVNLMRHELTRFLCSDRAVDAAMVNVRAQKS